jgi:TPP-dependent pyruvate/acetoin dehydrogenase alpha subunit
MKVNLTSEDLIRYEEQMCDLFAQKKIKAPIHLDNGNEQQLIEVFEKYVDEDDWVMGSWRMHYKSLLKGVPAAEMTEAILEGKSISLCFPKYKIIASAIVGGILPIAVGVAMGIKMHGEKNKAVCFVGDMTFQSGAFHECYQYCLNHDLSILFVIEDNAKSVCTDTKEVWNCTRLFYEPEHYELGSVNVDVPKIAYFRYASKYPHAGGLARVQF